MASPRFLAVWLLAVVCLFPKFSSASSDTDFSDGSGILSGSSAGMTLSGAALVAVTGYNGGGLVTGNLGSVVFATGAMASGGSLATGATFSGGGTFTVTGNGSDGLAKGTLFTGSFSGPVTWTLIPLANGTHNYTLTGVVVGTMGGTAVNGVTVQLSVNTGKSYFSDSAEDGGGDTTLTTSVPEPSTLAFFATGISMFGVVRRQALIR